MTIRALSCAVLIAWCCGLEHRAEAQVIHTPNDHVPNFAASPSIRSVASGSWSSAATWNPARVPGPADVVSISHTVRFDSTGDVSVIGIDNGGTLRFSTTAPTLLRVGTLMVLPGGTLEVGTEANPVEPWVTAQIVIADRLLDQISDPDQFGTGLIVVDGTVTIRGALKQPTFVRVAAEPRAGHTTIAFDAPVTGWRVGDRVFLPDTRQVPAGHWFDPGYPLQIDERTIEGIDANGRSITLSNSLSFDHRGARDADGTASVVQGGVALLPHVGNMTRNVIIRSENPSGTRGHAMFTHRSTVFIQYAQFQDLGRTRARTVQQHDGTAGD